MRTKETGKRSSNLIKNLLLTLVSTLITLLLVEVILRFFFADYLYTGSTARSLYYSSPNLTLTQDHQAVHYAPNTLIRSIAVYYNQIEYDTRHHANNFGFLSDEDYKKEDKPGILFLGDSFTAGVASTTPWIPQLNKKYDNINLYSMGVTGTGIWNFYNTLNSYKDKLNFDTIVVLSISDDLRRHKWYPDERNGYLYFCFKEKENAPCTLHQPIAKIIDIDMDAKDLLKPEELYVIKAYNVLKDKFEKFLKKEKSKPVPKRIVPNNLNYDMSYLTKIKALADSMGKKVIFVHIPEKAEAKAGHYRCNVKADIEKLGIAYYPLLQTHPFDMSMYHKHDGHPNDRGYAYLSSIMEEILKLK